MLITLIINPGYPCPAEKNIPIDTTKYSLQISQDNFIVRDNIKNVQLILEADFLFNSYKYLDDEISYISSFSFSNKINSFEIGNGLIGLQLVSFSAMKSGSAQAAAGRDLFLIYNPQNETILGKVLDFGITKQRSRYMGCLSAKSSHFILTDIDQDGLLDIGRIKEEMKCDARENDMLSEVYFTQSAAEYYLFADSSWTKSDLKKDPGDYSWLPLIDIQFNPVDFFAKMKWHSYNPLKWNAKSEVIFNPPYRQKLIAEEKQNQE